MLLITQFGCDHGDISFGQTPSSTNLLPLNNVTESNSTIFQPLTYTLQNCSVDCNCNAGPIMPLCNEETGDVFYSPCHAGCERILDSGMVFSDCSCMSPNVTSTVGFCEGHGGCFAGFIIFLTLTAITQFLGSTGIVGKMLIFHRWNS